MKAIMFDGRLAMWHTACESQAESFIEWGEPKGWWPSKTHVGYLTPFGGMPQDIDLPDDPTEAKAAWERAERWVRTGEL